VTATSIDAWRERDLGGRLRAATECKVQHPRATPPGCLHPVLWHSPSPALGLTGETSCRFRIKFDLQ
jgi:hypothetical protein